MCGLLYTDDYGMRHFFNLEWLLALQMFYQIYLVCISF